MGKRQRSSEGAVQVQDAATQDPTSMSSVVYVNVNSITSSQVVSIMHIIYA
jgi:hypothetical protein